MSRGNCRNCGKPLEVSFIDLGFTPLANSLMSEKQLMESEVSYPLHAYVCSECFLVQLQVFALPEEIFSDYVYFSSYSDTWLEHARSYVENVANRFRLTGDSLVIEIASNDGYLLQYFKKKGVPILGIEPAENVAQVANEKGIPTEAAFFGIEQAEKMRAAGYGADLMVANNVLAHVPDLNDFIGGFKILLNRDGVITVEFPHLSNLIEKNQFDTIYHEHFSYFSLGSAINAFSRHELTVFDVDELGTHGGSLRLYLTHQEQKPEVRDSVSSILERESQCKLTSLSGYAGFTEQVQKIKNDLLEFVLNEIKKGKSFAAYGAAAKGNTLLNFCGIKQDFIHFVADKNPHKQGKYMPGSHIPVVSPGQIASEKHDYILILPWNIRDEVSSSLGYIREWGGKFVVAIPELEIF